MIFKPELAEAVMHGRKTQTRRRMSENPRSPWFRERCAYQPGEDYAVQPGRGKPAIGRVEVIEVYAEALAQVTHFAACAEGFAGGIPNPIRAFFDTWEALHGPVDYGEVVWVVSFRPVSKESEERDG